MPQPDLRLAAVDEFNVQWAGALAAIGELERSFKHLAESIGKMAEHGAHQNLVMPTDLGQQWWVTFQESIGNLIPRNPAEAPIPVEA